MTLCDLKVKLSEEFVDTMTRERVYEEGEGSTPNAISETIRPSHCLPEAYLLIVCVVTLKGECVVIK